jgi:hypothetical protein
LTLLNFLRAILEAGERLMYFIKEKNQSEYEAWNNSSVLLVNAAKVIAFFVQNYFYQQNFNLVIS